MTGFPVGLTWLGKERIVPGGKVIHQLNQFKRPNARSQKINKLTKK